MLHQCDYHRNAKTNCSMEENVINTVGYKCARIGYYSWLYVKDNLLYFVNGVQCCYFKHTRLYWVSCYFWQFASWMVWKWYEWAGTPGLELLAHSDWICPQWGTRCGGEKTGGVCAPRGWAAHPSIGYTYDVIACALCDWAEPLWVWPKQHSGSEIRWNNGHYYVCFTGASLRYEGCALKKKKWGIKKVALVLQYTVNDKGLQLQNMHFNTLSKR